MRTKTIRREPRPAPRWPIKEVSVWGATDNASRKLVVTHRKDYVNVCGFATGTNPQQIDAGRVIGLGVNFHAEELRFLASIFNEFADILEQEEE